MPVALELNFLIKETSVYTFGVRGDLNIVDSEADATVSCIDKEFILQKKRLFPKIVKLDTSIIPVG